MVQCPICHRDIPRRHIERHVNSCIDSGGSGNVQAAPESNEERDFIEFLKDAPSPEEGAARAADAARPQGAIATRDTRRPRPGFTSQQEGKLYVQVMGAKDLQASDASYNMCCCMVSFEGQDKSTRYVRTSAGPHWGESVVFDVVEFFGPSPITISVRAKRPLSRTSAELGACDIPLLAACGPDDASVRWMPPPRVTSSALCEESKFGAGMEMQSDVKTAEYECGDEVTAPAPAAAAKAPVLGDFNFEAVKTNDNWYTLTGGKGCAVHVRLAYFECQDLLRASITQDPLSPLHRAAASADITLMTSLLRYVANRRPAAAWWRTKDSMAMNILDISVARGSSLQIPKLIIQLCGLPTGKAPGSLRTALHFAAMGGSKYMLQLLIDAYMKSMRYHMLLISNSEAQASLLNVRDATGATPLSLAAERGYFKAVQLLLDKGASVSIPTYAGDTPFMLALRNGHKTVADKLFSLKARPASSKHQLTQPRPWLCLPGHANHKGETALHIACALGNVGMARELVKIGCRRAVSTLDGTTPLHIAAERGNPQLMAVLTLQDDEVLDGVKVPEAEFNVAVSKGIGDDGRGRYFTPLCEPVNLSLVDSKGQTPLSLAMRGTSAGHVAVVRQLSLLSKYAPAGALGVVVAPPKVAGPAELGLHSVGMGVGIGAGAGTGVGDNGEDDSKEGLDGSAAAGSHDNDTAEGEAGAGGGSGDDGGEGGSDESKSAVAGEGEEEGDDDASVYTFVEDDSEDEGNFSDDDGIDYYELLGRKVASGEPVGYDAFLALKALGPHPDAPEDSDSDSD